MKKIYAVSDHDLGPSYFNTLKEAEFARRAAEGPEAVVALDPALECGRLAEEARGWEKMALERLHHLKELVAIAPLEMLTDTPEGRAVMRYLAGAAPEFLRDCRLTEG